MNKKLLLATLLLSAGSYNLFAADAKQHPTDIKQPSGAEHPLDASHAELKENMDQIHKDVAEKVEDTKTQMDIINSSFKIVERNLRNLEDHLNNTIEHAGNLTEVTKHITASPSTDHHEEPQFHETELEDGSTIKPADNAEANEELVVY